MSARKPQQNADSTIDIELDHPTYGWMPFTASPNDPHGADLYAQAVAGDFGPVAEYVPALKPNVSPGTPSEQNK